MRIGNERNVSLGYSEDFADGRNTGILPKNSNNKQVIAMRRSINQGSARKGHNLNQTIGGGGALPKFRGGTAF